MREFANTLVKVGKFGYQLEHVGTGQKVNGVTVKLPTRYMLAGRILDETCEQYIEELKDRAFGLDGTATCGWGMSSDGTTRYKHGMINICLLLPPKLGIIRISPIYWKLIGTRGQGSKTPKWQAKVLMEAAKDPDIPCDPKDLITIILDGACATSFEEVEKAFFADASTGNVVCQWCSTHSLQLLLKAVGNIDGIKQLIVEARKVITFIRDHGKPTEILDTFSKGKGVIKWGDTRFGTIFLAQERLVEIETELLQMIHCDEWNAYAGGTNIKKVATREKAYEMVQILEDPTFFRRMKKVMQLVEPIFAILRKTDSNMPTVGVITQYMLDAKAVTNAWEKEKFDEIDGGVAFTKTGPNKVTLLADGSAEDSKAGATASDQLEFRWAKMYNAGKGRGGHLHSAARAVNPCFREYEDVVDIHSYVRKDFETYVTFTYPELAQSILSEYEDYMQTNMNGDVFADKSTCDYKESKGVEGLRFWQTLHFSHRRRWDNLRTFAMRTISLSSSESDSERQFSGAAFHQPDGRSSMLIPRLSKLCFARDEILKSIATEVKTYTADWLELQNAAVPQPPPSSDESGSDDEH